MATGKKCSGLSPNPIQYIPLHVPIFADRKAEKLKIANASSNLALIAYANNNANIDHTNKAFADGVILNICPSMEILSTKQTKLSNPNIFEK